MRITYPIFRALTCLVMTTTQVHASTETQKMSEAIQSVVFTDPQKTQVFQTSNVAENTKTAEIKEKEKQSIELDNALARARLERELAGLQADIARLMVKREAMALKWAIEQEQGDQAHKTEMLTLNRQKEKLEAEADIAQYRLTKEEDKFLAITTKLDHQVNLLQAEVDRMNVQRAQYEAERQRAKYTNTAPVYLKEPLQAGGSLIISDRRIELSGSITPWKANYITDRIQYFNNKHTGHPIFIVIESSPGGSVNAGSCILKAMENSQAPVYVVVKSFAASMAALITTLADQSYAYPNAIILHHQPWTFTQGNIRELKEEQEFLQEWWQRLGGRVAKKMGVSLKKLDKLLYEKSVRGDWLEFADSAQRLKWVDHIINGIKDSGIQELPSPENYTWESYLKNAYGVANSIEKGVIDLPPLDAKDFYYLYNPDNRYRVCPTSK
jgi:ATP-dependent Clp protease, protease subunit